MAEIKLTPLIFGLFAILWIERGIVVILYALTSLISFVVGFTLLEYLFPQKKVKIKCNISNGISKIKKLVNEYFCDPHKNGLSEDIYITGCPEMDDKLKEIVNYFVEDILADVNEEIPPDSKLPDLLHHSIYSMLKNVSARFQSVDWVSFLTDTLPNLLVTHICLYKKATEKLKLSKSQNIDKIFFDKECELDIKLCHEKICTDQQKEIKYLRELSTVLLYLTMPSADFNNKPLLYLIRESLVKHVICPLLDTYSDPDKINRLLLQLLSKKSFNGNYTNEYFLQSIEMSNSCEELLAVLDKITAYENRMKSKDTGGTQDRIVKAQLSSLSHLRQVCARKIKKIKSGVTDGPNFLLSMLNPESIPELSLNQVLRRDVAVASFLDFLSTIGLEHYLKLHLSLAAYQVTASSEAHTDLSLFAMKIYEDLIKYSQTDNRLDKTAINSCLPKIVKGILKPDLFAKVQLQIWKLLQEDRCFGAFKSSSYYLQLLTEMDLLNENMEPLDSIKESLSIESSDSSNIASLFLSARILGSEALKSGEINYTLNVYSKSPESNPETWLTRRTYSQFAIFHAFLKQKFPNVTDLTLPQIPKMQRDKVDTKENEMNEYLQTILSHNMMDDNVEFRKLVTQFLNPFDWIKPQGSISSGIFNAVSSVGSGLLSVPTYFLNSFAKDIPASFRLDSMVRPLSMDTLYSSIYRRTASDESGKTELLPEDVQNIPVHILFQLIEEIFDLKQRNQIIHRGILAILHRIVTTLFGFKVNKMIVDQAINMTSAEQLATLVDQFIEYKWPEKRGIPRKPSPPERDMATKMRTRVLCRTKILGSFSSELSQYLGNQSTRQGVQRVFNMLQEKKFNRRFLHVSLESLVVRVFHQKNHLSEFFHQQFCPSLQSRRCRKSCANYSMMMLTHKASFDNTASVTLSSSSSSRNPLLKSKTLPY